jgi:glucosamine 6-phosphate synthetase-like amidotransferase/phosphosugar isomerase protein
MDGFAGRVAWDSTMDMCRNRCSFPAHLADQVQWVPETPWMLSPVTTLIPSQMLAYHIAALRGLDVDQPRNPAKSVTVE